MENGFKIENMNAFIELESSLYKQIETEIKKEWTTKRPPKKQNPHQTYAW